MQNNLSSRTDAILRSYEDWACFDAFDQAIGSLADIEVHIAGGAVRSAFVEGSGQSKDFDFFIRGSDTGKFLQVLGEVGEIEFGPFGSPRWRANSSEIYADIIPIESFNNGLWQCFDITDALNQFDFTANAIALNVDTHEICDPQNGIRDARSRIMRSVRFDYPEEPISERSTLTRLGVLWFRILHYSSTLSMIMEPITLDWVSKNKAYAQQIDSFRKTFFEPNIELMARL